jgi:hypothetical protein
MTQQTLVSLIAVLTIGAAAFGCKAGGVGDPCIPNDEFSTTYGGATESGFQIEDRSFQCETRVCLIKNFRGRVSCPLGNAQGGSVYNGPDVQCAEAGAADGVTCPSNRAGAVVEVDGQEYYCDNDSIAHQIVGTGPCPEDQLAVPSCYVPGTTERVQQPVSPQCAERKEQVYCSCRCDGDDPNANYCECPDGFVCGEVGRSLDENLVRPGDKYCIRAGDLTQEATQCTRSCDREPDLCGFPDNSNPLDD